MHYPDQLCNRTPTYPSRYWFHDSPHDPHTSPIVLGTFENVEQADEVRAFAQDLLRRNPSRKREAERPASFGDIQAFVASLKNVIAMQVYAEERESKTKDQERDGYDGCAGVLCYSEIM